MDPGKRNEEGDRGPSKPRMWMGSNHQKNDIQIRLSVSRLFLLPSARHVAFGDYFMARARPSRVGYRRYFTLIVRVFYPSR